MAAAPVVRLKSGCPDTKMKRDFYEWDDVVNKFESVKEFLVREPTFAGENFSAKFLASLTCDVLVVMEAMYGRNVSEIFSNSSAQKRQNQYV